MTSVAEIKKETERRMVVSIEALKTEFKHLRTGRASVALLDGVMVEYYGTPTPLNQVANLSSPTPRCSRCAVGDPPLPGHREGDPVGRSRLNPRRTEGRPGPVPQPTEERRKEIVKKAHALAEHAKVELRHHRHEANDKVKKEAKAGTISADEEKKTSTRSRRRPTSASRRSTRS